MMKDYAEELESHLNKFKKNKTPKAYEEVVDLEKLEKGKEASKAK